MPSCHRRFKRRQSNDGKCQRTIFAPRTGDVSLQKSVDPPENSPSSALWLKTWGEKSIQSRVRAKREIFSVRYDQVNAMLRLMISSKHNTTSSNKKRLLGATKAN